MTDRGLIVLTINKKPEGNKLTIALEGRLDTTTAPQLDSELNSSLSGIKELHFDLAELTGFVDILTIR